MRHARLRPRPVLSAIVVGIVALGAAGGVAYAGERSHHATPTDTAQASPATATSAGSTGHTSAPTTAAPPAPTPTPTPTPDPTPDPNAEFTIVAAGDVLPHMAVDADAKTANGGYDFTKEFSAIAPWLQGADLAICHFEVPVAPAGTPLSSYPVFGAPAQLVPALKAAGWDGCSTVSNHVEDRGFAGIQATLDAFDAAGLGHAGSARSAAEEATPQLYQLQRAGQTITVADIAATFGTNGMPIGANTPWSVDLIDVPHMIAQAKAARAAGADLVLASVHCCVEYQTSPTAQQQQIDRQLADSGEFDLVIGHHAHVPQPIVKLPGGPQGQGMWVAYGLGNFISNQDGSTTGVANTASGVLLTVHVESQGAFPAEGRAAGPAHVTGVEWTPITVDRTGGHVVYAMPDIPQGTKTLSAAEVAKRTAAVAAAVGTQAPERTTPPTPTGPKAVVIPRVPAATAVPATTAGPTAAPSG